MKIRIKITKEILRRSMFCGTTLNLNLSIFESCAFAVAIREIAPKAYVTGSHINWSGLGGKVIDEPGEAVFGPMSIEMIAFIQTFDAMAEDYELRLALPEQNFDVEVPDEFIETIGIQEVRRILKTSSTLQEV